jgi:phospholipid transport system substrate-binding protein
MKTRMLGCFLMCLLLGMPVAGWTAEGSVTQGEATTVVKRLLDSVRSYKKASSELSAQEKAGNAQAQKVAEETLAVNDFAQRALGTEWAKLKAKERQDFTQLLTSLFQKVAYPKSAEFFGELQIEFRNEKIIGTEAVVETIVSHPKEGRIDINYQLQRINNKWMIRDVLLDGVSMFANVRSQIQQVIAKESYQGLVKRMREKLAES